MLALIFAEAASNMDMKILIAAIAALSGAIGKLFHLYYVSTREVSKKLEACESRHEVRDKEFLEVRIQQAKLEGQMTGMDKLVQQVINSVKDSRRGKSQKSPRKNPRPAIAK